MRQHIAFFGASITQQSDGYAAHFARRFPEYEYSMHGFGSMHLNDAGVCRIDDVLATNPDWCVVDWFSTFYIKEKEADFEDIRQYIDAVVHRFYSAGVRLLFVMFPETVNDKREVFARISAYIDGLGIPLADLSSAFDDLSVILRDGIHTTALGSAEYGRLVAEAFEKARSVSIPDSYPARNKFCDVRHFDINSVVQDSVVFDGDGEVIGISQYIGPYTGLLEIGGEVVNNWDRWCYYEREMVNLRFCVNGPTAVRVLEDDFDRSTCEHDAPWGTKKMLKLMRCFWVGESVRLVGIS